MLFMNAGRYKIMKTEAGGRKRIFLMGAGRRVILLIGLLNQTFGVGVGQAEPDCQPEYCE